MSGVPFFLNVSQSALGRFWAGPSDETLIIADRLSRIGGLDPISAPIAARLGANVENLDLFCEPKLRDLLPPPSSLDHSEEAAARIDQALAARESVAIFADYDVDGAASAALLIDYFRYYDLEPSVYVPDRLQEGYGPNIPAMEELAQGHSLIICVDCGTLSFEPIARARAFGAEVIVLDHHQGGEARPDALIVNPNMRDEENEAGKLCAAGVVFLVLVALNARRRDAVDGGGAPDLLEALDLVALATIADVVPLQGVNRAFVRGGLQVMEKLGRVGLAELIIDKLPHKAPSAEDVAFTLAPRLNAGGRLGRAGAAAQLLTARSAQEARKIIAELEELNDARKTLEAEITLEAISQIEAREGRGEARSHLVYAYGKGWHPGVLGIVAARLKSHFSRPAIALGVAEGKAQGSGRSVSGVDLGGAVALLASEALIQKGGGHKMAAGLTLDAARIDEAMARLDQLLARQNPPQQFLELDTIIAPSAISLDLVRSLEKFGPFGAAAPAPRFALANMRVQSRVLIGEKHLRTRFRNETGANCEVMGFGAANGPLDIPKEAEREPIHIAITLSRGFYRGQERITARLEDWAWA